MEWFGDLKLNDYSLRRYGCLLLIPLSWWEISYTTLIRTSMIHFTFISSIDYLLKAVWAVHLQASDSWIWCCDYWSQ